MQVLKKLFWIRGKLFMKKSEMHHSLEKFEKAFGQLRSAVQETSDEDQLKQDGVIQRFEFTFELLWKTLREYLAFLGKSINNPRDTLKESFNVSLGLFILFLRNARYSLRVFQ